MEDIPLWSGGLILHFFSKSDFHSFLGSDEERLALETAVMYGVKKQSIQDTTYQPQTDVDMDFQAQKAVLGNDFKVTITFRNKSRNSYTATTYFSGNIVFYTGVPKSEFKKHSFSAKLEPSSCKSCIVIFCVINFHQCLHPWVEPVLIARGRMFYWVSEGSSPYPGLDTRVI